MNNRSERIAEVLAKFRKKYSDGIIQFLKGRLEPGEQISETLLLGGLNPIVLVICLAIGFGFQEYISLSLEYKGQALSSLGSFINFLIPFIVAYFVAYLLGFVRDSSLAVTNKNVYFLSKNLLGKLSKITIKAPLSSVKIIIKSNFLHKLYSQVGFQLMINGQKRNYRIPKQWKDVLDKIMLLLSQPASMTQAPPVVPPQPQTSPCPKCGNLLTSDLVFCNQCGNKVL